MGLFDRCLRCILPWGGTARCPVNGNVRLDPQPRLPPSLPTASFITPCSTIPWATARATACCLWMEKKSEECRCWRFANHEINRKWCCIFARRAGTRWPFPCTTPWPTPSAARSESIPGSSECWEESNVSEEEVSQHLERVYKDFRCSFCGKRGDLVGQMFAGNGDVQICDECVAEFNAGLANPPTQSD